MENQYEINYEAMNKDETFVPEHLRGAFQRWMENGIPPGSFGMAVLSNDLKMAYGRADHINKNHIGTTVAWFYNYAPSKCWGSPEAVETWKGIEKTE